MGVHFNSDLPELLTISRILPGNFCGFSALKLGGFIILTLGKVFVQLVTVADIVTENFNRILCVILPFRTTHFNKGEINYFF